MAKKTDKVPQYSTMISNGVTYYRTRIKDADGQQVALYAKTREELYKKEQAARKQVADIVFRRNNPTVADYCQKWLLIKSATISHSTMRGYAQALNKYIVKPLGEIYMADVTADDIRLALVPVSKMSAGQYARVNMLVKCIFYAAERSGVIEHNPSAKISAKGGTPAKVREALTDEQAAALLDAVKGLQTYDFIMIGLYAGLRREEILALQWDCVHLDVPTPYLSVRRAWRDENGRTVVNTILKSPAAKRDIPIPRCLVECLQKAKSNSHSAYVISNQDGQALTPSQFATLWNQVKMRSNGTYTCQKTVNNNCIKYTRTLALGETRYRNRRVVCSLDFYVTPHQLRHTYITNLLYAGVDPKTVQYLAGHENSKTTMDIYAKVKYNKPEELSKVVNGAFAPNRQPGNRPDSVVNL